MTKRHLEYFLQVYKYGSITAAAKKLYISPQGLSKTILELEKEMGVQLFDRSGKKMVPTAEAIRLRSHARNILREFSLIEKNSTTAEERKTIHIACCYDFPKLLPHEFYFRFYSQYPGILLHLEEHSDVDAIREMDANDVGLAILPAPLDEEKYNVFPFYTHKLCALIPKDHPLAEKSILQYEDLEGYPVALKSMKQNSSTVLRSELLAHKVTLNIILEVSDYHIIHEMAENGYALGLTFDYLASEADHNKVIVKDFIDNQFTRTICLACRKDVTPCSEAQTFRSFLLSYFNHTI